MEHARKASTSQGDGLTRTSSGRLSKAKDTSFVKKLHHKLVGATKLDFFKDSNKYRSPELTPQGMWWLICTEGLETKLRDKAFHRTLLEVMMFSYMGITRSTFGMLMCRAVQNEGEDHSLSVVDSSESCHSWKFMVTRFVALVVFIIYSVGFPLVMIFRSQPEKISRVSDRIANCKRKLIKKSGADEIYQLASNATAAASATWCHGYRWSFRRACK